MCVFYFMEYCGQGKRVWVYFRVLYGYMGYEQNEWRIINIDWVVYLLYNGILLKRERWENVQEEIDENVY